MSIWQAQKPVASQNAFCTRCEPAILRVRLNTLASHATAVGTPLHYRFAPGMGPCRCLQHSLLRLPSGFLARKPFGLQKVRAARVTTMTGSSLARNFISLLLVPNETPQPYKAPPSDAITPGDIHEPFLPNQFFQQEAKALVKQINFP